MAKNLDRNVAINTAKSAGRAEIAALKAAGVAKPDIQAERKANRLEVKDIRQNWTPATAESPFDPSKYFTSAATSYANNSPVVDTIGGLFSGTNQFIADNGLGYRSVQGDKESGITVKGGLDPYRIATNLYGDAFGGAKLGDKYKRTSELVDIAQNGLNDSQMSQLVQMPDGTFQYNINPDGAGEDYLKLNFTKGEDGYKLNGADNYVYSAPKVKENTLGQIGTLASIASMFIPGMQPIALGLNAANAIKEGDPLSLALAAYGGYNAVTGGMANPFDSSSWTVKNPLNGILGDGGMNAENSFDNGAMNDALKNYGNDFVPEGAMSIPGEYGPQSSTPTLAPDNSLIPNPSNNVLIPPESLSGTPSIWDTVKDYLTPTSTGSSLTKGISGLLDGMDTKTLIAGATLIPPVINAVSDGVDKLTGDEYEPRPINWDKADAYSSVPGMKDPRYQDFYSMGGDSEKLKRRLSMMGNGYGLLG